MPTPWTVCKIMQMTCQNCSPCAFLCIGRRSQRFSSPKRYLMAKKRFIRPINFLHSTPRSYLALNGYLQNGYLSIRGTLTFTFFYLHTIIAQYIDRRRIFFELQSVNWKALVSVFYVLLNFGTYEFYATNKISNTFYILKRLN